MKIKINSKYSDIFLRMTPYIKPYLFRITVSMIITIPIGALDAVIAFSLKPYMDQVMIEKSLRSDWYIPLAIIGFTLIQGILNYISTYLNGWLGQKITNDIKYDLYKKLLEFDAAFFDKGSSGAILARFNSDPELASSGLLNNVKTFFTRFFSSISLIIVLIFNSWKLAIIAVTVLFITLYPITLLRKRVKKISEGMVLTGGLLYTHYNETFAGNRLISSYNLSDYRSNKFKTSLKEFFNLSIKLTKLSGWITPIMYVLSSTGVALVIWYGSHLILTGEISSGAFVSFVVALIMLYNPIKSMGGVALAAHISVMAMERIIELFNLSPQIKDIPDCISLNNIENSIKFNNVWFSYSSGKPILKNINLEVQVGETIALVGNSGGGKSTLISLIPRFYDVNEGSIEIDGVNIKDFKLTSLRDKVAVVFQDNFLFEGSIRENIILGNQSASENAIYKALKDAYLDEFISTLPDGINTQIGERGILLSGGQKQRVAIARAFLKNAPIVILDEATSSLDNKSEAIVQKAIDRLMENRTVFVIAHRLSTVQNASRIVVIDDGKILEVGNHSQLMQNENGVYKGLYYSQFRVKEDNTQELINT